MEKKKKDYNNHNNNNDNSVVDYKLCGFLTTVLRLNNDGDNGNALPEFGTTVNIFSDEQFVAPLRPNTAVTPPPKKNSAKKSSKKNGAVTATAAVVSGVPGVMQQIRTLINQKCLRIVATVVGVLDGGEDVRVVVLVDVYLPEAVWLNNWQFPRSCTTAAALFRHLRCDWEERDLFFKDGVGDQSLLNLPDCHVLGCKQHSNVSDSCKTKGFELHEIFKSLPSLTFQVKSATSTIIPASMTTGSGIWDLTDDVLFKILSALCPADLQCVSLTCHHFRFLTASIVPSIKLKLFPHQKAAVEWMLQRERNVASLSHPMYLEFSTKDCFSFYINIVSGEIVTGSAPTVSDFHGGFFCDEPGLGKTITALSLILKTKGTLAAPPKGAEIIWCKEDENQKCGFYECIGSRFSASGILFSGQKSENDRRGLFSPDELIPEDHLTPKRRKLSKPGCQGVSSTRSCPERLDAASPDLLLPETMTSVGRCSRSLNSSKKILLDRMEEGTSGYPRVTKSGRYSVKRKHDSDDVTSGGYGTSREYPGATKRRRKDVGVQYVEDWVNCDYCGKWRRVPADSVPDPEALWFCSLNPNPDYRDCNAPEETSYQPLTFLNGFCSKDSAGELPQNVTFFVSVLKDHYTLLKCQTKKALRWLARLSPLSLSLMETDGLVRPGQLTTKEANTYHRIFEGFGLVKKKVQGTVRWFYPKSLENLVFDLPALRLALCEPLDSYKVYLSRATLIVVPSNLVDHWRTQIEKHVASGQLQVYFWTDGKKPSVHSLAWDYDVVITTFSRLSAEWNPPNISALLQVHWMRILLDEGHTLGSSLNLTNKMQMAVTLCASNRWILTGTPTPNTPSSQVSHLQPMLKFLHDEVYGESHKNWETSVLKPFEREMEEGKLRLLALLKRCMISARKADLHCIPPCIKKTTYVPFTEEHAKTYNELVETVRRNILLADWKDPSHVESLLNFKQWKFRAATVKNVRLSCCVAGHIKVVAAGHDIQETMDDLVQHGLEPLSQDYQLIKYYLSYGGNCQICKEWCRLPIVTPCRHLLCLDCVDLEKERCPVSGCGYRYEMQSPEILTRPENPNPKWSVPKDLIELQPSYKQDSWDPDWQSTSSSKVAYLVQRLKEIESDNREKACSTSKGYCSEISYDTESPQEPFADTVGDSSDVSAEKVLVFSQFLEHIHVIEQQLAIAGIKFTRMYSPMNASNKKKSLAVFQRDPSCMVLVMDGTAALGLDLSFVNYVFLMEPIWDRSMEEQVISRAHRMGAVRPIHVETLAMSDTIEEQMLKFLQNDDECRRLLKEEHESSNHEGARAHKSLHDFAENYYLTRLSMVRSKTVEV
ncbi:hypothetical protein RND81_10G059400 [Saponaria officinalis]|uniref:Uncharacterized protein n=2 Tax=Saponaria officinalis TaxID=3572 RepID=A0AAW1HZ59_SAPOF